MNQELVPTPLMLVLQKYCNHQEQHSLALEAFEVEVEQLALLLRAWETFSVVWLWLQEERCERKHYPYSRLAPAHYSWPSVPILPLLRWGCVHTFGWSSYWFFCYQAGLFDSKKVMTKDKFKLLLYDSAHITLMKLILTFMTPMAAKIRFLTVGSWPLRARSRSSSDLGGDPGGIDACTPGGPVGSEFVESI